MSMPTTSGGNPAWGNVNNGAKHGEPSLRTSSKLASHTAPPSSPTKAK